MTKRPVPKTRLSKAMDPRSRRKLRYLLASLVVALPMLSLAVHAMLRYAGGEHVHETGPRGGTIVSLQNHNLHYHAEVLLEKGGVLTLYLLGEDVSERAEAEAQLLIANVTPAKDFGFDQVMLKPLPQADDSRGQTSRFVGKLAPRLWGKPLEVAIPALTIAGEHYPLEFGFSAGLPEQDMLASAEEEEKLYLTSGGKYTEADIATNGKRTASQNFKEFKARHVTNPLPGDRICPISLAKAQPECSWVVDGKGYGFCCPPCIDEFVRLAKARPAEIKEPDFYVKRK